MASEHGHVKISRKAYADDPFWNEQRVFSKWEAWEWMIKEAAWKDRRRVIGMKVVDLRRGEFLASIRFLAEAWGWSKSRVHEFIGLLVNMERISGQRETGDGTVYLLVNYDQYQHTPDDGGTGSRTEGGTDSGQTPDTSRTHRGQTRSSKAVKAEVDTTTSKPLDRAIDEVILACNRGMIQNPLIDEAAGGIPLGHGSRQTVYDWLEAGIPPDLAAEVVLDRAKTYRPSPTRKRITTMAYFDGAVVEAWQAKLTKERTDEHTGAGRRGAASGRGGAGRPAAQVRRPDKYADFTEDASDGGELADTGT